MILKSCRDISTISESCRGFVGSATSVDWYNFIRDICIQYFIDHPAVLGGPGKEVEIDESKFGRRKYNRGRAVGVHWVFGGMERGGGESFLVEVARRDSAILLPIIAQYICPGTVVYSDEWSAYNLLATTGNVHLTVNHSLHFVDPVTGAHMYLGSGKYVEFLQTNNARGTYDAFAAVRHLSP
eukprot:Em0004g1023a